MYMMYFRLVTLNTKKVEIFTVPIHRLYPSHVKTIGMLT